MKHKDAPKLDNIEELSCGSHSSLIFADKPINTRYPDIQMILHIKNKLNLSRKQQSKLYTLARECFEVCEVEKSQLQLSEIKLRKRIIQQSKSMGKNQMLQLPFIAKSLKQLNADKRYWLKGHAYRYKKALKILSKSQNLKFSKILLANPTKLSKF